MNQDPLFTHDVLLISPVKKLITGLSLLAITACGGAPAVETKAEPVNDLSPTVTPTTKPYEPLVPGCETYAVYSQNRYEPYGTFVHDITNEKDNIPKKTSPRATDVAFAPNQVIPVDGWQSIGEVVYPTNTRSIRNNVWFHVAYTQNDWVTNAGVRGEPTNNDVATATHAANTSTDTGKLAELKPECQIK